jgi:hypothetical protein
LPILHVTLFGGFNSKELAMEGGYLFQVLVSIFVFPLLVLPTLGGGFVTLGFQIAKVPPVNYWRCWKVYLASCCYAFLALIPVRFVLQGSEATLATRNVIHVAVFCGTQLVLIPIFLKTFSPRALGIAGLAILLTNLITILLLWQYNQG